MVDRPEGGISGLISEIAMLDEHLLSVVYAEAPEVLSVKERISIRAYLIMAHSAIEEFIELCFSQYVKECAVIHEDGRTNAETYLAILQLSDDLKGQIKVSDRSPQRIIERLPGLYYTKYIKPNNGIKEKDISSLARGAGLSSMDLEDACPSLMSACDTLGAKRGEFAHLSILGENSGVAGVQLDVYPTDVRVYIENAVAGLGELVEFLASKSSLKN